MTDRSITARFDAKIDGYLSGVAKMSAATEKFSKTATTSATKHKADWDRVGKAAMVGGALIGAVVVGAAKAYADFEQAMSGVAAVADATAKQQDQLAEAAIKAGQATVFSASESAKAEAELAKAGVSVDDILGGGLVGSLNLAAAGQIDLANAATISAQAMNIFKLSGKDVGHIADVLTAGANKSAAGVDDLGMALAQGGLLAKQTGLSLEDTVGVLSAFADNALRGSDAGTSLKTMLQRLTPQSTEQAKAMEKLGLSFYDAQGNFVGITEAADRMQTAFRDLTPEQRNSAMATIFGSDAVRGANILYEQGAKGIKTYIDAVNDQGAAQRMAARQTDNLKGDIERLKGTLESAFIRGGKGGNAGLRSLVQDAAGLVEKFNDLPPATQANVVKFAALASAILLVSGGAIKATTSILAMKASIEAAGLSGARLATVMKAAGAATVVVGIAAVATELIRIQNESSIADVNVQKLAGSLQDLTKGGRVSGGLADLFRDENGVFGDEKFVTAAEAIKRFSEVAHDSLNDSLYGKFVRLQDLGTATGQFDKYVREIDSALAQMVQHGNADQAKASLDKLVSGLDPKEADKARAKFTEYAAALDTAAVSAKGAADAGIQLPPVQKAAAKTAEQAAQSTKDWADALDGLNSPALDARAAARKFSEAIWDARTALKENGKTLSDHTVKGHKNQEALDGVAKAALDQIAAMQANGASQKQLQGKLETSRARLYDVARQFGLSKSAAKKYVDQVLDIPATKTTTVRLRKTGVDVGALQRQINNLRGNDVRINVRYVESGPRPGGGRSTAGGQTKDSAAGGFIRGPGTATSDSIPARLSNGEFVMKAAAVDKYGVGVMHAMNDMRFARGGYVGFADGGEVDFSSIMALLGDITSGDDVISSRATRSSKANAYASARNALRSLIAQQRKAARDLAAARRAHDRDRVSDILDRQRVLLGKVAAAEGKVAAARLASANAARATAKVEAEYRADRRPIIDRATSASASVNRSTKAFLDNIDRLVRMGFKPLAMELLNMGGPEAEQIAAQAVRSATKAKALQSQFATSAALSSREKALQAALSGDLPDLSGANGASIYQEVRDLSGVLTAPTARNTPIVFAPSVTVQAGVGDPVAIGAAVEAVLVDYQNTTGNPLRITTGP